MRLSKTSMARLRDRAVAAVAAHPGATTDELARLLNVPRKLAWDALDGLVHQGRLTRRRDKPAPGQAGPWHWEVA